MHRVTAQLSSHFALQGIRTQGSKAAVAQQQLATGKRVRLPSDDPIAFRSIASLRGEIRRLDAELQSINISRGTLNMSLTRMTEVRTLLTSAKTTAQQGRDRENRETHAASIDSLLEQITRIANDQSEGRFVFGGAQPLKSPLQVTRDASGSITDVKFVGSNQPLTAPIGSAFAVSTSLPARDVFGGSVNSGDGQLTITARTGVLPGTGTDSSRGNGTIQVVNTGTSYAAGSGVAAGLDAVNDTIIGDTGTHSLTLIDDSGTGAFGRVSLNGGGEFNFTSADDNLKVVGANGEVAFLDLTSVTAGFNGNVDITANGSISIDGGATTVAIDFSSNQQLIHSETGGTVNVDTSQVQQVGEDVFDHPGATDIFQTLITLRNDLLDKRGLSEAEYQDMITQHLGEIERLTDHVLDFVGEQAVALENIDSAQSLSEDVRLETQISLSSLEDANLAEAVLDLQSAQTVLQSTYAATAQIFNASLLNYL